MKAGDTIVVKDEVTLPCCACAGRVTFAAPKDDPKDHPTFFHTMPPCERFDRTNTAEMLLLYLRDCSNAQKN